MFTFFEGCCCFPRRTRLSLYSCLSCTTPSFPFNAGVFISSVSVLLFKPSNDLTLFDRTSIIVSVYPISCKYLKKNLL